MSGSLARRVEGLPRRSLQAAQPRDLAFDLSLNVEWRLARPCAAMISRDHQIADLTTQLGIDLGTSEAGELGLDIDRWLAAAGTAGVAGGGHLTDLRVPLEDRRPPAPRPDAGVVG